MVEHYPSFHTLLTSTLSTSQHANSTPFAEIVMCCLINLIMAFSNSSNHPRSSTDTFTSHAIPEIPRSSQHGQYPFPSAQIPNLIPYAAKTLLLTTLSPSTTSIPRVQKLQRLPASDSSTESQHKRAKSTC